MYSGQIFEESVSEFQVRNVVSLVSNIVLLIAAVISSFFVNTLGRKTILMYGALLCCIFQAILCLISALGLSSLDTFSVVLIYLYYFAFNFSLGPIVWLYNSEVLPVKGVSIATFVNWLCGFILTLVLPQINGIYYLFGFFTIICFVCFVFVLFVIQETKGKTKSEITNMYLPLSMRKVSDLGSPVEIGTHAHLQNPTVVLKE